MRTSGKHSYDGIDISEGRLGFPKRITASTESGRAWFARAWLHVFNFNHEAALLCFKTCTEVDPECAMGFWGTGELQQQPAGSNLLDLYL